MFLDSPLKGSTLRRSSYFLFEGLYFIDGEFYYVEESDVLIIYSRENNSKAIIEKTTAIRLKDGKYGALQVYRYEKDYPYSQKNNYESARFSERPISNKARDLFKNFLISFNKEEDSIRFNIGSNFLKVVSKYISIDKITNVEQDADMVIISLEYGFEIVYRIVTKSGFVFLENGKLLLNDMVIRNVKRLLLLPEDEDTKDRVINNDYLKAISDLSQSVLNTLKSDKSQLRSFLLYD